MKDNHLPALSENLDLHSSNYEKLVILVDFNIEIADQQIKDTLNNLFM